MSFAFNWKGTEIPPSPCPFCDRPNDVASEATGHSPGPGDVAVCLSCASVLVFSEDMHQRAMTKDEWDGLDPEFRDRLRFYQSAVRSIDRSKTDR